MAHFQFSKASSQEIILGIDPGSRITGYGILKTSPTLEALDFGCIRPPLFLPLEKRYLIIFEGICKLIETFSPTVVAIESQFFLKNAQSTLKIGMVKGLVFVAAAKYNLSIYEYSPRKAKLSVVGNGNASKEQVQKMIQRHLKLPNPSIPEDAADGLALALCHFHQFRFPQIPLQGKA